MVSSLFLGAMLPSRQFFVYYLRGIIQKIQPIQKGLISKAILAKKVFVTTYICTVWIVLNSFLVVLVCNIKIGLHLWKLIHGVLLYMCVIERSTGTNVHCT